MNHLTEKFALSPANILLPKNIDMAKWSVVACDQYTSEPEYWDRVKNFVGDSPSTLNLILPETYLNGNTAPLIEKINAAMNQYLTKNLFEEYKNSYIYAERTLSSGKTRKGLIAAIDLERYDFSPNSKSTVRATEGTILERIPPRKRVRINAPLELPHIMLLIDDKDKKIIEGLQAKKIDFKKAYDFELMEKGGHIAGWAIGADQIDLYEPFSALAKNAMERETPLIFALGDGNHSLATAKDCWEDIKKTLSAEEIAVHPARFALAEIVNIHDESLEFEPIHRVLFNVNAGDLLTKLREFYPVVSDGGGHIVDYVSKEKSGHIVLPTSASNLAVGALQKFLDHYLRESSAEIDYVHGDDVVRELGAKDGNIGFLLPKMEKSDLFKTVVLDGALPRKTFSMGHAEEKRFYLECKRIR